MAANIRCIMRAKANYGAGLSKLKVNLTPTQSGTPWKDDTVNNAPYVFRSVPMGNREWNKLVGGTVAWNQLVPFNKIHVTQTVNQVTMTNNGDGSVTFSGTATAATAVPLTGGGSIYFEENHVYFLGEGSDTAVPYDGYAGDGFRIAKWKRASVSSSGSGNSHYAYIAQGATASGTFNVNVTDLTAYLGSAIADYVYSLEQATAGSGIAWLKKYDLIDDQYHAYSAPTLQSVEATSHIAKDGNGNVISTTTFGSVTLRGIPKKDANGNLYYDGDTYERDGTVTRKYAEIDLTDYTFSAATNFYYRPNSGGFGMVPNTQFSFLAEDSNINYLYFYGNNGILRIYVEDISKPLTGSVIYPLNTPTTESADPYTNPQVCDPNGTEEWTDYGVAQGTRDYAVPVGHESTYAMAYPIEGVDSFTVTADDGTTHTYPVSIGTTIYKGTVDVLGETYTSEMTNIASYNGETIGEPWLSSLDEYSPGTTPTTGAQVVYTSTPTEGSVTVTGEPSTLSGLVSVTSDKGDVDWNELSEIGIKCVMKLKDPLN